jgi:hypothetical protein
MSEEDFSQYISTKTLNLIQLYSELPEDFHQIQSPLRDNLAAAAAGAAAGALAYKAAEHVLNKMDGAYSHESVPVKDTDFDL